MLEGWYCEWVPHALRHSTGVQDKTLKPNWLSRWMGCEGNDCMLKDDTIPSNAT